MALNSPTVITLQLQVFFNNTCLYISSYVLLDLKVHPSANKLYSSIILHCLINDTYGIQSHQSCGIYFLCMHVKKILWSKWTLSDAICPNLILQVDSVTYYPCKARGCSILDISLQITGAFTSGKKKKKIIIPYLYHHTFRYFWDATVHLFQSSSKRKGFKKGNTKYLEARLPLDGLFFTDCIA